MHYAVSDKDEILLSVIEHKKREEEQYGVKEGWISFTQLMEHIHQYSEDGVFTALEKLQDMGLIEMKYTDKNKCIIRPTEKGENALPLGGDDRQ